MPRQPLSGNDNAVLGALFDPEASLSNNSMVESSRPDGFDEVTLMSIQRLEKEALLPVNGGDPSKDDILVSISSLSSLIEKHPRYASAWNNRGQARRMLFNVGSVGSQGYMLPLIVEDLDQAINLATPASPLMVVPEINAKVLASAHTHRGLLFWAASRSDELRVALTVSVHRLNDLDAEKLEEIASLDFAAGGRYGNHDAKQLAVKLNPYAKLCGSIVKEAMQKEMLDFYQIPVAKVS